MYDRILLAVDGSDEAERAAARGLALADRFDAAVDVLYVLERAALDLARTSAEEDALDDRAEAILADVEELAAERGQSVATHATDGAPAARIAECAAERDASLIVVGRQGRSGLGERVLGSVTERLVGRSEIPVLVVPAADHDGQDEVDGDYSSVLVPTDGSENAEVAIPHGVATARRYDADVHVLNVVDLHAAGGPFDAGGLRAEFVERLEARGEDAVDRVASEIDETAPGLEVTTAVERTKRYDGPVAAIRDYVRQHEVDLVVMGSHGRSNLRRQLLGSVTATLLRTIDVPVLVVKRPS